MEPSPNWLDRYRQGQRGRVWDELRQLGSTVREPDRFEEAQLVCDEMARRARQNVEMIVERLSSEGYRFHTNDYAQTPVTPYVPPTAASGERARKRPATPLTRSSATATDRKPIPTSGHHRSV